MTDQIITVIARLKAKPGLEDSVRQELFKLLAPTRSEKGCINYDMHQSCDDASFFSFTRIGRVTRICALTWLRRTSRAGLKNRRPFWQSLSRSHVGSG